AYELLGGSASFPRTDHYGVTMRSDDMIVRKGVARAPVFAVDLAREEDQVFVKISGELDIATVGIFKTEIAPR
ncbi:MAG: hypothetical protein JWM31_2747, partial [Solirubrobacterales bacterium]|nr:hypothetical protein [Solirubrobacterales bacterium]